MDPKEASMKSNSIYKKNRPGLGRQRYMIHDRAHAWASLIRSSWIPKIWNLIWSSLAIWIDKHKNIEPEDLDMITCDLSVR